MRETLRKEQLIQRILLISMILLSILLGTIMLMRLIPDNRLSIIQVLK